MKKISSGKGLRRKDQITLGDFAFVQMKSRELLAEWALALQVVIWLHWLAVMLKFRSLPALLESLSREQRWARPAAVERDRAIRIVTRVCRVKLFRFSLFPRACLRRSLALYYVLNQMGYPVEIRLGVHKQDGAFHGHSWVTINGEPIDDKTPLEAFRVVYRFPPGRSQPPDDFSQGKQPA